MKIEIVQIADLKPFAGNPRKMAASEMKKLENSIKKFSFVEPVVVNKTTGNIVGGHTRSVAAKNIGLTEVPVVYVTIPEGEEKALNLALNKIHGEWDEEKLALLLKGLNQEERELSGFEEKEILKMIKDETKDDEYVEPEKLETKVKSGELWKLGEHLLLCGDSTKHDDVKKLMGTDIADMVFTDPPYGVSYVGKTKEALTIENDSMDEAGARELWEKAYTHLRNFLKEGGGIYVTVPPGPLNSVFVKVMHDLGDLRQQMVWVKDRFVMGRSDYHYRHEPILYGWKSGGKHCFYADRDQDTVWEIKRPSTNAEHPTMKPIELMVKAIRNSSQVGEIVFDGFGGSGSTLIACEQTGRKARTIEYDEKYASVILDRWQKLTGKVAELVV